MLDNALGAPPFTLSVLLEAALEAALDVALAELLAIALELPFEAPLGAALDLELFVLVFLLCMEYREPVLFAFDGTDAFPPYFLGLVMDAMEDLWLVVFLMILGVLL